jgi:hypothetical protein
MSALAIRAVSGGGFRITLDLSSWGALGVSLAPAVLRLQAWATPIETPPFDDPPATPTVALEFLTGGANPATFDPATGLAVFSAPATATAALLGTYACAARAEFGSYEIPLFSGSLVFSRGVVAATPTTAPPTSDTAYVTAHPYGPAPAPAPIAAAVAAAQAAAQTALVRSIIFG